MTFPLMLLLPHQPGLVLDAVTVAETTITVTLRTTQDAAACPLCGELSIHRQSRYQRHMADLMWATYTLVLQLGVRRFFCRNSACPRRIFCERLSIATAYARYTRRLLTKLTDLAGALGGRPGAVLAAQWGITISRTTLLTIVRRQPLPPFPAPRVIGVDEFAFRKRQTYGTIFVDLETHRVIDLLPERSVESCAAWLRAHPTVEIVSRDRSVLYADAIRRGAPQAQQVADRFHLEQNLTEVVRQFLIRKQVWTLVPTQERPPSALPLKRRPTTVLPKPVSQAVSTRAADEARRQERYHAVMDALGAGASQRDVAKMFGMSRGTISRYVKTGTVPQRRPRPRPSTLDPYIPYLQQRWDADHPTLAQFWQEIRAQGYTGSLQMVQRFIAPLRPVVGWQPTRWKRAVAAEMPAPARRKKVSATEAAWVLVRPPHELTAHQQDLRTLLVEAAGAIAVSCLVAQTFVRLVQQRKGAELDEWLRLAENSGVDELARFAQSLREDKAAVQAGLTDVWNNGPTEGHVNRLKMLKRTMFGRARFDLLRARVLMNQ